MKSCTCSRFANEPSRSCEVHGEQIFGITEELFFEASQRVLRSSLAAFTPPDKPKDLPAARPMRLSKAAKGGQP